MKNRQFARLSQAVLAVVIAATIFVGAVAFPQAQAASTEAPAITLRDDITVDYKDYVDSSVMFQLPDTVKSSDEISVIITVDVPNLMDAYEGTDKAMSFAEYALHSEEAAALEAQMAAEQIRILEQLDALEINYTVGEVYTRLLSGFEIRIKAADFNAVTQSLGDGENAIVGEEYQVAQTQLVENTVNVYETGIFKSGDSGYDGSGMVVEELELNRW